MVTANKHAVYHCRISIHIYILSDLRKLLVLKQLLFSTALLFLAACMFISCNKTDVKIIPGKYNPAGSGVGSSNPRTGGNNSGSDSSSSTVTFFSPDDVAVDATGNIYVADYGNNIIRKITPAGLVTTLAGNGNIGATNGNGTLASFNGPSGLAVDATGNVYVADAGNNLIRKITPAGIVSTLAGTVVAADTSNTITNEPVFSGPSGVAVDASGNVYVADAGNNRICVINQAGAVSTLAGKGNSGATDGAGASATFNNPTGVAVDLTGNVFVADFLNNRIRKITPGGLVSTLAGDTVGHSDGIGAVASFYFPNSLAVDASGTVYVTDDANNLIRKIAPDGTVTTIAGNGNAGSANGLGTAASFNDPSGIAIDNMGNLFVADANNNLIRKIDPSGLVITLAGTLPKLGLGRRIIHAYYHAGKALNNRLNTSPIFQPKR